MVAALIVPILIHQTLDLEGKMVTLTADIVSGKWTDAAIRIRLTGRSDPTVFVAGILEPYRTIFFEFRTMSGKNVTLVRREGTEAPGVIAEQFISLGKGYTLERMLLISELLNKPRTKIQIRMRASYWVEYNNLPRVGNPIVTKSKWTEWSTIRVGPDGVETIARKPAFTTKWPG